MNPSYNNGVGAQAPQGTPQMPITSGAGGVPGVSGTSGISGASGGDIVVGGAPEKKSRKGVVILIVLVALLVLVGGGYLLWRNVGGNGNKVSSDFASSFNEFANYMYSGEESEAALSDIPDDAVFDFQKMLYSDDGELRVEYFTKAEAILEKVENGLNGESGLNGDFRANLDKMIEDAIFVIDFGKKVLMSDDEVILLYLDAGSLAKANAEIADLYSGLVESNNDSMAQYGNDIVLVYKDILYRVDQLNVAGCLGEGGNIEQSCADGVSLVGLLSADETNQLSSRIGDFMEEVDSKKNDLEEEIRLVNSVIGETR